MSANLPPDTTGAFPGRPSRERGGQYDGHPSRRRLPSRKSDSTISGVWKIFGEAHKSIYLGSGGRLGDRLLWIPMLLLSTRGRRTGLVRTMPLAYLPDPEDPKNLVIVASNGGSERPPAWWLNLTANRIATVQVGKESFWAEAVTALPERREQLWNALRKSIPPYRIYESINREIPIVLLRRIPAEEVPLALDPSEPSPLRPGPI